MKSLKLDNKKAKSQASKLGYGAAGFFVIAINQGFATRGLMEYIANIGSQEKLIGAAFVVILMGFAISVCLKKAFIK